MSAPIRKRLLPVRYPNCSLEYQKEDLATNDQDNFVSQLRYLHKVVQENSQRSLYAGDDIVTENVDARTYRFTCKECHSLFNKKRFFKQHILVHRQMYECAFCNARFVTKNHLLPHMLLHMSTYKCVYCESAFASKELLVEHISRHDTVFFECDECEAKFVDDEDLQDHEQCHLSSGTMIHVFRRCEKVSQQEQQMMQMNEQQLQQQSPEQELEQQPSQEQAMNQEEGEKQRQSLEPVMVPMNEEQKMQHQMPTYEPECMEKVSLRVSVPKLQLATGRRYYACGSCYFYSLEKWNIRRHSKIHERKSEKYLHFCSVCGARFRANSSFIFHMKFAHQVNP